MLPRGQGSLNPIRAPCPRLVLAVAEVRLPIMVLNARAESPVLSLVTARFCAELLEYRNVHSEIDSTLGISYWAWLVDRSELASGDY